MKRLYVAPTFMVGFKPGMNPGATIFSGIFKSGGGLGGFS